MSNGNSSVNMSDLIRRRRSVRTFDGKPLSGEETSEIMEFASKAENPFNISIEWKLLDSKKEKLSVPVIAGTDLYIAGKMRHAAHAEEAFGYTFEKIVLFAESLGIGTTWIAGTMDRKGFERAMDLSEEEVMPCISPLGHAATKMSFRETMMRKGIKADSRLAFEKLFFEDSFDRPMPSESAGDLALAFEMVRLGPSATNSQPWRLVRCGSEVHFYEKKSRGMSSDTWDVQKIDMGIALCHFELGAVESGLRPVLKIEDPGLSNDSGLIYIASFRLD